MDSSYDDVVEILTKKEIDYLFDVKNEKNINECYVLTMDIIKKQIDRVVTKINGKFIKECNEQISQAIKKGKRKIIICIETFDREDYYFARYNEHNESVASFIKNIFRKKVTYSDEIVTLVFHKIFAEFGVKINANFRSFHEYSEKRVDNYSVSPYGYSTYKYEIDYTKVSIDSSVMTSGIILQESDTIKKIVADKFSGIEHSICVYDTCPGIYIKFSW